MKKNTFFSIALVAFFACFWGCNRPSEVLEPIKQVSNSENYSYRDGASDMDLTIEWLQNRTDGVYYETAPEGYTPVLQGDTYHHVSVFIDDNGVDKWEIYHGLSGGAERQNGWFFNKQIKYPDAPGDRPNCIPDGGNCFQVNIGIFSIQILKAD